MQLNDRIEDTPVDLRITQSWWGSAEQYGRGMFIALVKRVSVSLEIWLETPILLKLSFS